MTVAMTIPVRDADASLTRALESVASQTVSQDIRVLIANDGDADLSAFLEPFRRHLRIEIINGHWGHSARVRNALWDALAGREDIQWWARLDDDDYLAADDAVEAMVETGRRTGTDVLLGGNRLARNGQIINRTNPASADLLRPEVLLTRLELMAAGEASAELPSCNIVVRAGFAGRYPDVSSAEDHWLVAKTLLTQPERCAVVTHPYYAVYHLDGATSQENRRTGRHLRSRRLLFSAAKDWMTHSHV